MTTQFFRVKCMWIVIFGFLSCSFLLAAEDSTHSLEVVVKGMENTKRLLENVSGFKIICKTAKIEQVTPSELGRQIRAEWTLIRNDRIWRVDVRPIDELKRSDGTPFPMTTDIIVAKNNMAMVYTEHNEIAVVYPLMECSDFFQQWGYFVRTGFCLFETMAQTNQLNYKTLLKQVYKGSPFEIVGSPTVPEFLNQNIRNYTIAPKVEIIDGHACVVVQWPQKDVMWVDPEHGFVIRKRVFYFSSENVKQFEIQNRDFVEVQPGLWLPQVQIETCFADVSYQPQNLWDKPLQRIAYEVSIDCSRVDVKTVEFTPPVGTRVTDVVRHENYRIYDPNADPFAGPIEQGLKANRYVMFRAITIIIGSILIFIAVWQMLSRMEKK